MGTSLAQHVAALPEADRESVLADLDPDALLWDWSFWARPEQLAPPGDWNVWVIMAGRGAGKSRSGAEWVRRKVTEHPGCRIGLVGRSAPDVSKVMIYGESGIMGVFPEKERPVHKISRSRLEFPNGSIAETFSAEEPSQLRGPAFHYAWADEPAAWQATKDSSGLNSWDNLRIATREGHAPQIVATTTPKRTAFMNDLLDEHKRTPDVVVLTRGSTYDNAGNLSQVYLDNITGVYAGTSLARQELEGLMLDDADGALWTPEGIERYRSWSQTAPVTPLRVVAVDPSVAERPRDECGIVVVGATNQRQLNHRHAFVLEDASLLAAPEAWAREVARVARKWRAPIVAEVNQGGALVKSILTSAAPEVPVYQVRASKGKRARAEPVTLPYQQGRVHHWGSLVELEDQLTTWDPEVVKDSPDRLDALVWGLTALLVTPPDGLGGGRIRAVRTTGRRLPTGATYGRARLTSSSSASSAPGRPR